VLDVRFYTHLPEDDLAAASISPAEAHRAGTGRAAGTGVRPRIRGHFCAAAAPLASPGN